MGQDRGRGYMQSDPSPHSTAHHIASHHIASHRIARTAPHRATPQHTTAHHQGIQRVDVPDRKIQHGSTSDPQPLRSPTLAAVAQHVGRAWVTDSPEQQEEALAGALEIQPSRVLRYMGIDIYLQGTPTAPRNLPQVRAAVWKQLRP